MMKISKGLYLLIIISYSCYAVYAPERTPTCYQKDINSIKVIAEKIYNNTLADGKCLSIEDNENNNSLIYYQYTFSSSPSSYTCRIARSALIVTNDSTKDESAPLLKCVRRATNQ